VACTVAAVIMPHTKPVLELLGLPLEGEYLLLCLAALLWGTSQAAGNVLDSSLADSVATGTPKPIAWQRDKSEFWSIWGGPCICHPRL